MATEHTINSSLLFLTLILGEMPNLTSIEQVTEDQSVVVWDKKTGSTEPDLENYKWGSFKLVFSEPFNISSLMVDYPSSIKNLEIPSRVNSGETAVQEEKAAEEAAAAAKAAEEEYTGEVSNNKTERRKNTMVYNINSKNYSPNAPNGMNPSNIYSGIGPAIKNQDGWHSNFIHPGPPVKLRRAFSNSANSAIKEAKRNINRSRKKKLNELSGL
jgi:hypothetical protein